MRHLYVSYIHADGQQVFRSVDASKPWRLALLLHSEEHASSLRREAACAFYTLPWLSPVESLGQEITSHPTLMLSALQNLEGLVVGRERVPATEVTSVAR